MKLISWNVNGIRACLTKGFAETFKKMNADIFAYKKQNANQNKQNQNLKDIQVIGIAQRKKDIPELQYLQNKSL